MSKRHEQQKQPFVQNDYVEEFADADDLEAQERMKAANQRQRNRQKNK